MSGPSNYLLTATGDFVVSNVNPFITELTTSNSNINGATFTPALGDWIYYLFWDPTAAYTVTPPSTVTSVNFVVVGGGSGGNGGNFSYGDETANGDGITLAGGSSGAVCAGSVIVNPSNYTITVGAGGAESNGEGQNPPYAGNSSSIVAADGGNITCSEGSPAQNVTGIAGTVSTTSSNDLSYITIPSQNNSNNVLNFGIGGTDVNFGSNTNINGGPGLSITFADSLGPFLFGGGGGGGNDYQGEDGTGAPQGGNGSNGSGGQGGSSINVSGGGGGGGGSINSINTQYIGSAQNGSDGTASDGGQGGTGGNANVGGGGGGGGAIKNGQGGQGGNGLVMIYYQIPSNTTVSNGLTIQSTAGSITLSVKGTGPQPNARSILPSDTTKSSYVLEFNDSENQDAGIWVDPTDFHGGFCAPYDARLQKDVAPMKKTLEQLLKLKPISFKMDNSNKLHAGFSDDNISHTFPSVMSRGKYSEIIKDNVQGVNMTALMPIVVKSIQELNTELKTQVDTLNTTVKTLKTEMDTVKQNNDKLTVEDVVGFVKNLWSLYKKRKN